MVGIRRAVALVVSASVALSLLGASTVRIALGAEDEPVAEGSVEQYGSEPTEAVPELSTDDELGQDTLDTGDQSEGAASEPLDEAANPDSSAEEIEDGAASDDEAPIPMEEHDKVLEEPAAIGSDESPEKAADDPELTAQAAKPQLSVQSHVQNIGWQNAVSDGKVSGTSGKSLRVEGIKIAAVGKDIPSGSIEYCAHVQNVGWQGWVKDGAIAGTSGKSLRIEALKIRLTGALAEQYDVYYQTHVQNKGWMNVARNGEASGSAGYSYRVEALRVWLVAKGDSVPVATHDYDKAFYGVLGLTVQAHVQNIGWQRAVGSGALAGTTGRSLRVEALKLSVSGLDENGGITYRAHVQNVGWQGWKKDGEVAGTVGRGLRVEAIEAKLTGDLGAKYDLYYRVHVQNVGWLAWAKAGETAGSEGMLLRVEALQVRMVAKGDPAPSNADAAYAKPCIAQASVEYASYVQNAGSWQSSVKNGATSGTTGKSLYIEGIRLAIAGEDGSIAYRACLPGGSWTSWSKDGADLLSGGKRIEGIQVKLSGAVSQTYDVWYRAHVQNVGWTGWAKNGASVGSTGLNYRIEAYQVKLVSKVADAPGDTYRPYVNKDNLYDAMSRKAQGYSSRTNYLIMVDTKSCYVGIYKGSKGAWNRVQYWRCSVGSPSTPTILGAFDAAYYKTEWFGHAGEYRCWYATQISGDYLLHSVLYTDDYSQSSLIDGRLGKHISQGCVRLDIKNAKWIYSNIPAGTKIVTYS